MKRKFSKTKTCRHEGCNKTPSFNEPGEKVAKYCADHKSSEMKNVIEFVSSPSEKAFLYHSLVRCIVR